MNARWLYLVMAVPTLTELLESGRLPTAPRDILTDVTLALLLGAGAWLICRQTDRLKSMTETDSLTGLFNSRRLWADLPLEIERARRFKLPLALAYADVDRFKSINDEHGHAEGDAVLARIASLLRESVRRRVDRVYRLGGDEFALLLPGTEATGAAELLRRIARDARHEPTGLDRYGASLSVGVAELDGGETWEALLKRADDRMYAAKAAGKDRVVV